jgi:hypothetical protein
MKYILLIIILLFFILLFYDFLCPYTNREEFSRTNNEVDIAKMNNDYSSTVRSIVEGEMASIMPLPQGAPELTEQIEPIKIHNVSSETNDYDGIYAKSISTNDVKTNIINSDNLSINAPTTTFQGDMVIQGKLCFNNYCLDSNDFNNMVQYWSIRNYMYPSDAWIMDIFGALGNNTIKKSGSPRNWDDTTYKNKLFLGKNILSIGSSTSYLDGIVIDVYPGRSVIWIQAVNDRWESFILSDSNGSKIFGCRTGYRKSNPIDPNGKGTASYWGSHIWYPMALPNSNGGTFYLHGSTVDRDNWISGIAFSQNPWNHASCSAATAIVNLNGDSNVFWDSIWHEDVVVKTTFSADPFKTAISTFFVPVVPSGKDKIVYFVNTNDDRNGTQHRNIKANGEYVERFSTAFDNPFATYTNSKPFSRYMATLVPNSIIPSQSTMIKIEINMTGCDLPLFFREYGSHDYL